MSSNIPNSQPIPLTLYMRLDAFRPWLQAVLNDLITLWNGVGTPELIDSNAAYTLVLKMDALPIPCAEVRVQPDSFFSQRCHVAIKFTGNAATLTLFAAFIHVFEIGLSSDSSPFIRANKEHKFLIGIVRQYAKWLPPALRPGRTPRGIHPDTRNRLNDVIRQRATRIQENQWLLSRTDAYRRAGIDTNTVKRYAPELHEKWMDRDYLPGEFVDTAQGTHSEQGQP